AGRVGVAGIAEAFQQVLTGALIRSYFAAGELGHPQAIAMSRVVGLVADHLREVSGRPCPEALLGESVAPTEVQLAPLRRLGQGNGQIERGRIPSPDDFRAFDLAFHPAVAPPSARVAVLGGEVDADVSITRRQGQASAVRTEGGASQRRTQA